MLSLQQIKSYYPESLQTFERFMIREYLQYKILEIIYNTSYASRIMFLGGTCLRIVHENQRFSEDMDFDNFNLSIDEFSAITQIVEKELSKSGYEVEVKNVWKGAYYCYIRFPSLLYKEGLSFHKEEKILIQIDTEPHNYSYIPEKPIINKFDVFTQINSTPLNLLLSQKFYAVLNRRRNKGRDFYDIIFLLGRGIIPEYSYLEVKTGIKNPEQLREQILKKCSELDMVEMASDVKPFLFNINDIKRIALFPPYMETAKLSN